MKSQATRWLALSQAEALWKPYSWRTFKSVRSRETCAIFSWKCMTALSRSERHSDYRQATSKRRCEWVDLALTHKINLAAFGADVS